MSDLVERVAVAIIRADQEPCPDYEEFPDNPEISDWGIHLARAAIEAMQSADTITRLKAALERVKDCARHKNIRPLDEIHAVASEALSSLGGE